MNDASVLLWITRFPLPFLPASDEFAMNYEGLGFLISRDLLFIAALTFHGFGDVEASCTPVGAERGRLGDSTPPERSTHS
jgi:hypothetical protein